MCKHVAATLYGVGARLDDKPELLFRLRKVDEMELVAHAGAAAPLASAAAGRARLLDQDGVAELFGLELDGGPGPATPTLAEAGAEYAAGPRRQGGKPARKGTELDDELRARVAAEVKAALAPTLDLLDSVARHLGLEVPRRA